MPIMGPERGQHQPARCRALGVGSSQACAGAFVRVLRRLGGLAFQCHQRDNCAEALHTELGVDAAGLAELLQPLQLKHWCCVSDAAQYQVSGCNLAAPLVGLKPGTHPPSPSSLQN
ncbi:unnamed protein product [Phytophthora fragariaefolia]|uniref:Unnamed protein product n=1 Tax=Phytophthora fragariaefolia TaxID=1490495 RepID=A0A9W6Y845_9STRA|nr:unnamed protein product [Phytophthora fragariaefolia]